MNISNNILRLNTKITQSLILPAPFRLESVCSCSSLHLTSSLVQHSQLRLSVYCLLGKSKHTQLRLRVYCLLGKRRHTQFPGWDSNCAAMLHRLI